MPDAVLTINAGSSSLKFSIYRVGKHDRPLLSAKGQVEGIGTSPHLVAEDAEARSWSTGAGRTIAARVTPTSFA